MSLPGDSDDDSAGEFSAPASPARSDSPPPDPLPGREEREGYYYGLPSTPIFLGSSSLIRTWTPPHGPFQYNKPKYLQTIGYHPQLRESWQDMCPKFQEIFDRHDIPWTSIEAWRIGSGGNDMLPVLWIGVRPGCLIDGDGNVRAVATRIVIDCKEVLRTHGIFDMECELKESEVNLGAYGPSPLGSSSSDDIKVFFTHSIGTCIGAPDMTHQGTFGFYLRFSSHPGDLFGVTCRHVLFDLNKDNKLYRHKFTSQKARSVLLPPNDFLDQKREEMKKTISDWITIREAAIQSMQGLEGRPRADEERETLEKQVSLADDSIRDLKRFGKEVAGRWTSEASRTIGHVFFSPPIEATSSSKDFTADWCLYKVDETQLIDFEGNVVDLGSVSDAPKLTRSFNPNIRNSAGFKYPGRKLPILNRIVPIQEMYHPKGFDQKNQPAISVGKRGRTTGVTVGVFNEIDSVARIYFSDGSSFTAREMAIIGAAPDFSRFSDRGDSGSLIWDVQRRPAAMLTGGSGNQARIDVTYATPLEALFSDMEKYGFHGPTLQVVTDGASQGK